MAKQLKGWATSSASPEEVSSRIKGAVLAGSGVIVWFLVSVLSVNITIDNIIQLAPLLGTLGGAVWSVWGACMALVRWYATVK